MSLPKYTAEELLIDDSFYNYCLELNEEDIFFWTTYLELFPEEKSTIQNAKKILLGLHSAIHEQVERKKRRTYLFFRAAAILVLFVGCYLVFELTTKKSTGRSITHLQTDSSQSNFIVYTTAPGERKKIRLPDSSVVELNVASRLQLTKEFNHSNRDIYLEGEALFDVTHNKNLPFIVQTPSYEVRVLGTLFNVKAYPGEAVSETSLIRGKVKLFKPDGGHLTLLPLQKAVFENQKDITPATVNKKAFRYEIQHIMPVHQNLEGTISEISWTENRMEFNNESFLEIKDKIERWYNVELEWTDSTIGTYRFTGSFHNEPIEKVLEALQFSYPFEFTINKQKIYLTK
jgi:ferric-dicitrate binding protein FerR (iron transport regulator)